MNGDDELLAGVPTQKVRHVTGEVALTRQDNEPVVEHPINTEVEMLEKGTGIPQQVPSVIIEVRSVTSDDPQANDDFAEEILAAPSVWQSIIRSPLLFAILLFFLSAFLIVVFSEVFQFAQAIQTAWLPLQIAAYLCVGGLILAFGWSAFRLVRTFGKLTTSPLVVLASDEAASRALTRRQLERQLDSGYQALRKIVDLYPIDDQNQIALLKRGGMDESAIATLRSNIEFLKRQGGLGNAKWLADCDRLFVRVIDTCAKKRVGDYAKRVAVKTALMPTGLIDSLIVSVNAVLLVEELCRCYAVRTSLGNSILLVVRLMFTTFVSAKLEDQIEEATNSLFEGVISSIPEMTKEVFAKLSLGVLKRSAEGTVNCALFYRLGGAAILYLRPIRLK